MSYGPAVLNWSHHTTSFSFDLYLIYAYNIWASLRENHLVGFVSNKGADHPAHPRSLISTFVICFLESIISRLTTSKISNFNLVSVAEQVGLNLTI